MPTKKNESASTATKKKVETKAELRDRIKELEALVIASGDDTRKKEFDLRVDDFIDVVSLFNSTLSLSTEGHGKGRIYTFTEFGQRKPIIYSDVMAIIENQMHFLRSGLFYIASEDVIKRHGLVEIYAGILDKEKIEKVIECGSASAKLYESANKDQRKNIDRILVSKLVNGEKVDLNVVSSISRIRGKDLAEQADEIIAGKLLVKA